MSASPNGTLYVVCGSQWSAGSEIKSASVSKDQGRMWRASPSCAARDLARFCGGYLGSVDAVSESTAYVIGWRSSVFVTHDGGARWSIFEKGAVGNANGAPSEVHFFDPDRGFVLGELDTDSAPVAIWSTSDGGASWSMILPRT
jgi:photosystem II stability/assembly factor-like uncharacterized protein